MQNQVVTSASPQGTRWLERMSSWLAPLKSGYPLRERSDFSIDRLDSAPRQELSLREIADSSVRSLRQPAQEEFAARFRIPLGTLRDWEQGRSEPD